MKAYIQRLLRDAASPVSARNLVREYLQARTLECLQRSGAMVPLAFHGGIALRFLYAMPRYSEDLDFALERPGTGYDFRAHLRAVQDEFVKEGYQVGIKAKPLPIWPGSARCRRADIFLSASIGVHLRLLKDSTQLKFDAGVQRIFFI